MVAGLLTEEDTGGFERCKVLLTQLVIAGVIVSCIAVQFVLRDLEWPMRRGIGGQSKKWLTVTPIAVNKLHQSLRVQVRGIAAIRPLYNFSISAVS